MTIDKTGTRDNTGTRPVRNVGAQPVKAAIGLAFVLFVIFAAGVLLLSDKVTSLLVSPIAGTLGILGFLCLARFPLRAIALHRSHLAATVFLGGAILLLLLALLYAAQAGRLVMAGTPPDLVFGVLSANDEMRGLGFTTLLLVTMALNSFLEEGPFRGLMLPSFMRRMSFWKANALQAALFGLWHKPFAVEGSIAGSESAAEALVRRIELFAFTASAGLVFGYLYYRTGNLWAPWLAHTIDNLVLNVFHLQVAAWVFVEADITLLASLIGYPLLVLAAWAVSEHFDLPRLQPWAVHPGGPTQSPQGILREEPK